MAVILVVDDRQTIRQLISEVLKLEHTILEAENGEEAIKVLEANEDVSLMILDLEMPVTDGWECLNIVRDEEDGWPNLPVIILTVRNEPENVLKAWGSGAAFYMTKPFTSVALLETVNKALGQKKESPTT